MPALLLRPGSWLPRLLLVLLALGLGCPARASHLLGGELTYRYLDSNGPDAAPLRYELTVTVYNNCDGTGIAPRSVAYVGVYEQGTGNRVILTSLNYSSVATLSGVSGLLSIPQTSASACISPSVPSGCTVTGPSQPYILQKFVAVVNLPASSAGYYAVFSDTARNNDVANLNSPGSQNLTLYTAMAPPAIPNRSPVFSDIAVAVICANDTTLLLNSAVDPDGDRLAYKFGQPYGSNGTGALLPTSFVPPPVLVPYQVGGYGVATPFGAGAGKLAAIDGNTGLARYSTPTQGKYAVAVDVQEYRLINGVEQLIGTTRRDLQLVVASCPTVRAPVLPTPAVTPRSYTIEAGSTLTLPITVTQRDSHPLQMTVNSELLDGPGGHSATLNGSQGTLIASGLTGTATASGTNGTVTGTLVFNSTCTEARTIPYSVALSVKDIGCAGKTVYEVFNITVTKPRGPTAVAGPATVCGLNTTQRYSASGGTAPTVSWRVVGGGTIVGSSTANPVQVAWPTAGTFRVVARGVSQYNCRLDSVSYTVTVSPGATLTVSGPTAICAGSSTTLTLGGSSSYTITGGSGAPLSGAGPFTLSPAATTTYTVAGASSNGSCVPTTQVTVTVNSAPAANVGQATRSACSNTPLTLGAAAVTGSTYSWSPTTGLSSPTAANPTLTLPNTTGMAITQTYTLTETSATGCTASNSVAVTVNPAVTASAGPPLSLCAGATGQLGAAAVAGYTYSWSPATGLSNPTVANPSVTLTNTTGAATTQTYTLTATNTATGCTGTATVVVTVNPTVTANAGAPKGICSGASAQLGAAPVAGYTYSWSPATGLSNPSVANPSVTLTNTTNTATTQTYTLTAANTATGCTGTATVVVTVNPTVTASAGAAITICPGSQGQLGAAAVPGFSYNWSPATGLSSATTANPTVTLPNTSSNPVTQTYTLTTTNAATGCAGTATVVVTVSPPPVAQPGAAATSCAGASAQLGAAPVPGYTYSWSPSTGLSSPTVANPTATLPNTGSTPLTQTYTLTTANATGCVATGSVTVTVLPLPVPQPGAAVAACSGASAQLGATPVPGYTYSWSPATGLSSPSVANPTVTLTNTTGSLLVQTYTLTVTNPATGCASTGTVVVTVNVPVAGGAISADQTVCAGTAPAALASQSSGNNSFGYTWESSPDNATWTVIAGASGSGYAPGALTATTYFRRRATLGSCGSAVSNVVKVMVTQPLLAAVALATPPQQCAGLPFTFTPVPTNAGATPTYVWYVNNTPVATTPTYTSTTLRDGDAVRVELTPTAGFCAVGPASASVTIRLTPSPAPTVRVAARTALPVCVGTPIRFEVAGTTNLGTPTTYQWQVDGVAVAGATGTSYSSSQLRDGQLVTVALSTTTPCGPVTLTAAAVQVRIVTPVRVSAGPDKEIMEGEEVVLEATANGSYPLHWTPLAGLSFVQGDTLHPRAAPLVTTTYTLRARTGDCADSSAVTVTVRPRLRIPTAISPNGDGQDDTWEIDHLGDYPGNKVLVFNRWGNKIFEASGYARGTEWNGTIEGQPAPIGTYYYVITLGNGRKYSGPITVVY